MRPAVIIALVVAALLAAAGCSSEGPTADTPEGALKLFIDSTSPTSPDFDPARAFKLLAPDVRRELGRRAELASKQGGRRLTAQDMLIIERVVPRWQIKRMETSQQGDRAVVTVSGKEPSQTAEVALRREDGRWTIELPL